MKDRWKQLTSPQLEEEMEQRDIPESDRDEVRKFSEVLGRIKRKRDGLELPPAPVGMREFITGADTQGKGGT